MQNDDMKRSFLACKADEDAKAKLVSEWLHLPP